MTKDKKSLWEEMQEEKNNGNLDVFQFLQLKALIEIKDELAWIGTCLDR